MTNVIDNLTIEEVDKILLTSCKIVEHRFEMMPALIEAYNQTKTVKSYKDIKDNVEELYNEINAYLYLLDNLPPDANITQNIYETRQLISHIELKSGIVNK